MPIFTQVDEEEILVLSSFDHHGELVIPEFALGNYLSRGQIKRVLERLYKKGLIKKTKPLNLTKAGKLKVKEIKSSALSRNVKYGL